MNIKLTSLAVLLAVALAACGAPATPAEPTPDVAAVRTSAASTVHAGYTLTAAVFTPTQNAPILPTDTPIPQILPTDTLPPVAQVTNAQGTPEDLCDSLSYDPITVDVSVPDNTVMTPGQEFIKTWRVKNAGSCPWGAGYVLAYAGYTDQMNGQFIALTEVIQPGQEVEVSVQFKAPSAVGEYLSAWQMRNPQGITFEEIIFVKIIVQ